MEDLTRLGKRIVFLGKGVFLSLLGMAVLFGLINGFFGNPVLMGNDAMSMSVGLITLLLLLLLSIFVLLVFCLVGGISVLVWTFRVTKNLRTKAKKALMPFFQAARRTERRLSCPLSSSNICELSQNAAPEGSRSFRLSRAAVPLS